MTRCFFQTRGEQITTFPLLPPLAGHGNSASIITSSYIFSLPVSLMFFFFFPFSFFFPSPDHTVHTTDSDQRAASKPEQETRAKGVLSLLLPPPPPPLLVSRHFSSNSSGRAEVLSEAMSCLSRAVASSPFLFSFFFDFISLRQFSAECRGPGITGSNRRAPEHGKGTGARVEDS